MAFLLATAGFTVRMLLSQRAPITNMYESIVWAAWGVLILAMLFEAHWKTGVVFLSALPVSIAGFILAHAQPSQFDATIRPLPPILQDQFWLFTHVTTVIFGYAAFAFAMGQAHRVLWKQWRGNMSLEALTLPRSLQIGLMLLSLGILLGGFWGKQAWGRFWAWDPKETWALITLLVYAALLQGHKVGWWSTRGLAIGSIVAFQCVIFTWYGLNFLGGNSLHSYGWSDGGLGGMIGFALVESVFLGVTLSRHKT